MQNPRDRDGRDIGHDPETEGWNEDRATLELRTIEAIIEHRRRIVEAEAAHGQLLAAENDGRSCTQKLARLRERLWQLNKELSAHIPVVNDLVEQLGFVPDVRSAHARLS